MLQCMPFKFIITSYIPEIRNNFEGQFVTYIFVGANFFES